MTSFHPPAPRDEFVRTLYLLVGVTIALFAILSGLQRADGADTYRSSANAPAAVSSPLPLHAPSAVRGPEKPTLRITTARSCAPCRALANAWESDDEFRDTLTKHFRVEWHDASTSLWCPLNSLPSIEVPSTGFVTRGYQSKELLLAALGLKLERKPPPEPVVQTLVAPPAGPSAADFDKLREVVEKEIEAHRASDVAQNRQLADTHTLIVELIKLAAAAATPEDLASLRETISTNLKQLEGSLSSEARAAVEEILPRLEATDAGGSMGAGSPEDAHAPGAETAGGPATGWFGALAGWVRVLLPDFAAPAAGLLTGVTLFGVPATAAVSAAVVALRLWKRARAARQTLDAYRAKKQEAAAGETRPVATHFPRQLDEALELLQLRWKEGRAVVIDALTGMLLDDELKLLIDGEDPAAAQVALKLKQTIDSKVLAISPVAFPKG
ncbi:MAG: hypothetical protein AB7G12_12675 [Thermoanaerobaculia bacterium]